MLGALPERPGELRRPKLYLAQSNNNRLIAAIVPFTNRISQAIDISFPAQPNRMR